MLKVNGTRKGGRVRDREHPKCQQVHLSPSSSGGFERNYALKRTYKFQRMGKNLKNQPAPKRIMRWIHHSQGAGETFETMIHHTQNTLSHHSLGKGQNLKN